MILVKGLFDIRLRRKKNCDIWFLIEILQEFLSRYAFQAKSLKSRREISSVEQYTIGCEYLVYLKFITKS